MKLAQRASVPMSQTAKELGIGADMLRRWVKEYGVRTDGSRTMTPEQNSANAAVDPRGIFTKELL